MAFSNGVFSRLYNWVNDKAASINITASRFDAEDDGFATGLSTCMLKDGTQILTANIPFAGFKITGYGTSSAPSARSDVPSLGQVEDGVINWVAAGGTSDAITAGYSPAITALVDGQLCFFRASAANATNTPTFSPNGLTARTITKKGGIALAIGDIQRALAEVVLRYNLANLRWEMVNAAPPLPTRQVLSNTASSTYTRPTGCTQIRVRASGAGGGTGGNGTSAGAGGDGADTTFSTFTAGGGKKSAANAAAGGAGGTVSVAFGFNGAAGAAASTAASANTPGGNGGQTPFGGGGAGGAAGAGGGIPAGSTGSGAGGAGAISSFNATGGGGAGGYIEDTISNPSATYTYQVGAGGTAGTGGTGGSAGAAGANGTIIVDEYYN